MSYFIGIYKVEEMKVLCMEQRIILNDTIMI